MSPQTKAFLIAIVRHALVAAGVGGVWVSDAFLGQAVSLAMMVGGALWASRGRTVAEMLTSLGRHALTAGGGVVAISGTADPEQLLAGLLPILAGLGFSYGNKRRVALRR